MNNILLSISIPSYNQTDYLLAALNSIIHDSKNINNIEINISDNSSYYNDKKKMFNNITHKLNHFKSNCNSMDSNINNSIVVSKGEYVWIFGDDDLIIPGSLKKIINYLDQNKPDVLIVNSASFINDEKVEKNRCKININKKYNINENDHNKFLEEMGGYLTYIGSIIIRKKIWIDNFKSSFEGSYFAHLGVVLSAKLNKKKIHYLATPSINMRLNSQTWTSNYFKIWNFNYPELIWSFNDFSINAKKNVISEYPYLKISRLLSLRAYNKYNISIFYEYYKNKIQICKLEHLTN